jgi:hypothetical protein
MGHEELRVRRERREWLLRVCSQSLQRQQAGRAAAVVVPVRVADPWRPVPGWAGQNSPEASAPALEQAELEAIAREQSF